MGASNTRQPRHQRPLGGTRAPVPEVEGHSAKATLSFVVSRSTLASDAMRKSASHEGAGPAGERRKERPRGKRSRPGAHDSASHERNAQTDFFLPPLTALSRSISIPLLSYLFPFILPYFVLRLSACPFISPLAFCAPGDLPLTSPWWEAGGSVGDGSGAVGNGASPAGVGGRATAPGPAVGRRRPPLRRGAPRGRAGRGPRVAAAPGAAVPRPGWAPRGGGGGEAGAGGGGRKRPPAAGRGRACGGRPRGC
jgi:hypothetical protein